MLYGPWIAHMITGYFTGKTIKAMAVTSAYEPATVTTYRSTIYDELAGGGYPEGGVTVTGVVVSWDATTERVVVTCNVVDFGAVTASDVGGIVFYLDSGDPATDRVLWTDVFEPVTADGALSYQPAPEGAMEIRL